MNLGETEFRKRVLWAAARTIGVQYWWGGNDPTQSPGLDCSGFVLYAWRLAGLDLPDQTAEMLRKALAPTQDPQPGDVAFYGDSAKGANHIVLVLAPGGKAIVGANGGGSIRANEAAIDYQARMARVQASVRVEDHRKGGAIYRGDLLGFGRVPWEMAGAPVV